MKLIKTLLLLLITFIIFLGFGVLYLTKFDNDSFLGSNLKEKIIKHQFLINIFNYNKPGDAKYIFLSESNQLNVEIHYFVGYEPSASIDGWVQKMVKDTTGKRAVIIEDKINEVSAKESYTIEDLGELKDLLASGGSEPKLDIFYVSLYDPDPQYLGITLDKDTIYIFKGSLDSIIETQTISEKLEESTLMHEWGHLLGLGHIEKEDCVMSEMVHFYVDRGLWVSEVPTEYCAETLFKIGEMRSAL